MTSRTPRWSDAIRHGPAAIIGLTALVLGVPMTAKAQAGGQLSLSPVNVVGGLSAIGTVRLFGPAPAGGRVVQLSSSSPGVAKVPERVTIRAGDTLVSFGITTIPVSGPGMTYVHISAVGASGSPARLGIEPPQPSSLTFAPERVTGGHRTTGQVGLNGAAAGDLVVSLSLDRNSPAVVTVPASVTVPARAMTANFTVTASPVGSPTPVLIKAHGSLGRNKTASLTVVPPVLSSLTLAPSTVTGRAYASAATTGTVTLTGPAPPPALGGGRVVQLSSGIHQAMVQVPPTVTVPAGETTVSFGIVVLPLGSSGGPPLTVTLTATAGGVSKTAQLTVNRL